MAIKRGSTTTAAAPAMWLIIATVISAVVTVARAQQVPCYFIFGDSVVDNGNNNNLKTEAKVNYSPYGVDYSKGPTGRFSNGRNIPDFIAQSLGFKDSIPPFDGSSPTQTAVGFNYASGGAGIREETSQTLGARISLKNQIVNHESAIKKAGVAPERLNQCLYMINIGSNDYINNYFMPPPYTTRPKYTPQAYADTLVLQYASYLMKLHELGARKVGVLGITEIGCIPRMIRSHGGGKGCAEDVNYAAGLFNTRINAIIAELNKRLVGAHYTFIDLTSKKATKEDYAALGFTVLDRSCCTVEPGKDLCTPNAPVCPDRTKYIFWDDVHGTEAVNALEAMLVYKALAASYNFTQLQTNSTILKFV